MLLLGGKVKPIRPEEAAAGKLAGMPEAVIEAFNEQISRNFDGAQAKVTREDAVSAIVARGYTRRQVFDSDWLDVEPIYEDAGWEVKFDKPGFNESYPAFFVFSKKKK